MIPFRSRRVLLKDDVKEEDVAEAAKAATRKTFRDRILRHAPSFHASKGALAVLPATYGPNIVNSPLRPSTKEEGQSAFLRDERRRLERANSSKRSLDGPETRSARQPEPPAAAADNASRLGSKLTPQQKVDAAVRLGFNINRVALPLLGFKQVPTKLLNTLARQLHAYKAVSLADNELSLFPKYAIEALDYVQDLNLRSNKLRDLGEDFGLFHALHTLDVSYNKLFRIPVALANSTSLEVLRFGGNQVKGLPQPFCMPALKELDASHNIMEFLPDGLQHCSALTKLDLSFNMMPTIAILPAKAVAKADDLNDPIHRPWEWVAKLDPRTERVMWYHPETKIMSRIDPRYASAVIMRQLERAEEHANLTRNAGVAVTAGMDMEELEELEGEAKAKLERSLAIAKAKERLYGAKYRESEEGKDAVAHGRGAKEADGGDGRRRKPGAGAGAGAGAGDAMALPAGKDGSESGSETASESDDAERAEMLEMPVIGRTTLAAGLAEKLKLDIRAVRIAKKEEERSSEMKLRLRRAKLRREAAQRQANRRKVVMEMKLAEAEQALKEKEKERQEEKEKEKEEMGASYFGDGDGVWARAKEEEAARKAAEEAEGGQEGEPAAEGDQKKEDDESEKAEDEKEEEPKPSILAEIYKLPENTDEVGFPLPEVELLPNGKVKWDGMEPIKLPDNYKTPRLATSRFEGQVLRVLQGQGRGEWDILQNPRTGDLVYRNNISLEELPRPPDGVDHFGGLVSLRHLNLSNNKLVQIPASICTLTSLEELIIDRNNLTATAFDGDLVKMKLKELSIRYNKIGCLQEVITRVTTLERLAICGNCLDELPPEIGRLVNLKSLWLSENNIADLPSGLATCAKLEEIRLGINPLSERWRAAMYKGVDHVLWEARHNTLIDDRGAPPKMTYDLMGINNEAMVAHAEAKVWHQRAIKLAKKEGKLQFAFKDLKIIPHDTFSLTKLKQLSIVGNDINHLPADIAKMTSLTALIYHNNKTRAADDEAFAGLHLKKLSLADNKLKAIPTSTNRLESLTYLSIANNRIKALPDMFGIHLPEMRHLVLDNNKLTSLPASMNHMTKLEILWVSRNRLTELPSTLGSCTNMTELRANSNRLAQIDRCVVPLPLTVLEMANNKIVQVPKFLFVSAMRNTLRRLLLNQNHILDVRPELINLRVLDICNIDANPLISPPPEVIHTLEELRDYCELRMLNIKDFLVASGYHQFVIEPSRAFPRASNCLVGGLGYLTEADLTRFDRAFDYFCNGRCHVIEDADAMDIIERFVTLRARRADTMRYWVMQKLCRALEAARINRWVDEESFASSVARPWGPGRQFVRCFAITADALFGNNGGRDSVMKRVLKRSEVYFRGLGGPALSLMSILDTLRNFRGPFGLMGTPLDTVDFVDPALKDGMLEGRQLAGTVARERGYLGDVPLDEAVGSVAASSVAGSVHSAMSGDEEEEGPPLSVQDEVDQKIRMRELAEERRLLAAETVFRPQVNKRALVVQRMMWTPSDRKRFEEETAMLEKIDKAVELKCEALFFHKRGKALVKLELQQQKQRVTKNTGDLVEQLNAHTQLLRDASERAVAMYRRRQKALLAQDKGEFLEDPMALEEEMEEVVQELHGAMDDYAQSKKELDAIEELRKERKLFKGGSRKKRARAAVIAQQQREAKIKFLDKARCRAWRDEYGRPWDGVDGSDYATWKSNCVIRQLGNGDMEIVTPLMQDAEVLKEKEKKMLDAAAEIKTHAEKAATLGLAFVNRVRAAL